MEQSDIDLLLAAPSSHLQALAKLSRQLSATKGQSTSASLTVEEIAEHLFDPSSINEAVQGFGQMETAVLFELVACGGRANSRDLALYLTRALKIQANSARAATLPSSTSNDLPSPGLRDGYSPYDFTLSPLYPTPHPHGVFELSLRRLLLAGLVYWGKQTNFAGRDYASGIYDGVLIVPKAVLQAVQRMDRFIVSAGQFIEAASQQRIASTDQPIESPGQSVESIGQSSAISSPVTEDQKDKSSEGFSALQRTLYLYWSLVAGLREGLALLSSGFLARPALRQVVESLKPSLPAEQIKAEQEVPYLLFIRLLLMKLGLLYERRGNLYAAPSEAYFMLPLLERARRCYHLWLETSFWNEMAFLPDVVLRPTPTALDPAHEEVMNARKVLIERILAQPSGQWCELATFVARTKLYAPYLLFPRRYGARAERYSSGSNPYGWDFRLRRGWLTHREGWHQVEGGFIQVVVSGPMSWLGVVELNNEEKPVAFRPATGITLLTEQETAAIEEPAWGRLIVQPNFELIALAPLSEALLVNLDRFAERMRLEHIAQYRITKASVTQAIQKGLHAETIQQTLEQASGGSIPQNVQYSLQEWERQARRVELWQSTNLLEVKDPSQLDKLFADGAIRPLLGRRLSPLLVEIPAQSLETIQTALWERGHLPGQTSTVAFDKPLKSGHFEIREPQWKLHSDGLLQPCYPVTDLYLASEAIRISTLDEDTGWRRITPASIQHALEAHIQLEHIIYFLQHYCEGGIPPSFLVRLKLWGGGYGTHAAIQVESAPLLHLSAQVLQDLRADGELQSLLGTDITHPARFVRIPAENLERVVALLKERGFEVE